jgi:hypothetical protein
MRMIIGGRFLKPNQRSVHGVHRNGGVEYNNNNIM